VARWQAAGAAVWRTDLQGALTVESGSAGLVMQAQREADRRYWNTVLPWIP
jgi:competence protein ComEC